MLDRVRRNHEACWNALLGKRGAVDQWSCLIAAGNHEHCYSKCQQPVEFRHGSKSLPRIRGCVVRAPLEQGAYHGTKQVKSL